MTNMNRFIEKARKKGKIKKKKYLTHPQGKIILDEATMQRKEWTA
jgi:hypothetical protein